MTNVINTGHWPERSTAGPRAFVTADEQAERMLADQALELARRENFVAMCADSLWGTEAFEGSERYGDFGTLLDSLVVQYKPTNRWALFMLSQVADAYWKLERLSGIQRRVYDTAPRRHTESGLLIGTQRAMGWESSIDTQRKRVGAAIASYRKAVKA